MKIINSIWDNISAIEIPESNTFRILHKYLYRNNIHELYDPKNSNIQEASSHSKKIINKAEKNNILEVLNKQFEKMVSKKCFIQLTSEEISNLQFHPHFFTLFNYVENPNSVSTPFRLITNTSSVGSCTTISTEQLSGLLNPQENSLIRFCLHSVPLVSDIKVLTTPFL